MSLVARHLESHGIPTVVLGAARDIVEECGVARFVFTDFPLGNPCGRPHDPETSRRWSTRLTPGPKPLLPPRNSSARRRLAPAASTSIRRWAASSSGLQQQRALDADVELAQARVAHAQVESRRFWAELKLDTGPDLSLIEDQVLVWSELVRNIEGELPDWQRQTEDELLAAQSINRDDLDRTTQRVLDQRVGTARETLAHVGALNAALADLDLLMTAVDNAIADYSSRFRLLALQRRSLSQDRLDPRHRVDGK